jgi:hypothetical protein
MNSWVLAHAGQVDVQSVVTGQFSELCISKATAEKVNSLPAGIFSSEVAAPAALPAQTLPRSMPGDRAPPDELRLDVRVF